MPISSAASPERCFSLKSVLLASDFSEASRKALRHALAVARHFEPNFTWRMSSPVLATPLRDLKPRHLLANEPKGTCYNSSMT